VSRTGGEARPWCPRLTSEPVGIIRVSSAGGAGATRFSGEVSEGSGVTRVAQDGLAIQVAAKRPVGPVHPEFPTGRAGLRHGTSSCVRVPSARPELFNRIECDLSSLRPRVPLPFGVSQDFGKPWFARGPCWRGVATTMPVIVRQDVWRQYDARQSVRVLEQPASVHNACRGHVDVEDSHRAEALAPGIGERSVLPEVTVSLASPLRRVEPDVGRQGAPIEQRDWSATGSS